MKIGQTPIFAHYSKDNYLLSIAKTIVNAICNAFIENLCKYYLPKEPKPLLGTISREMDDIQKKSQSLRHYEEIILEKTNKINKTTSEIYNQYAHYTEEGRDYSFAFVICCKETHEDLSTVENLLKTHEQGMEELEHLFQALEKNTALKKSSCFPRPKTYTHPLKALFLSVLEKKLNTLELMQKAGKKELEFRKQFKDTLPISKYDNIKMLRNSLYVISSSLHSSKRSNNMKSFLSKIPQFSGVVHTDDIEKICSFLLLIAEVVQTDYFKGDWTHATVNDIYSLVNNMQTFIPVHS